MIKFMIALKEDPYCNVTICFEINKQNKCICSGCHYHNVEFRTIIKSKIENLRQEIENAFEKYKINVDLSSDYYDDWKQI